MNGFREEISGGQNKTVDTGFAVRLDLSYKIWTGRITYRFLDEEDKISAFQTTLSRLFEEAGCGGLVTLENIRIIHYLPGNELEG